MAHGRRDICIACTAGDALVMKIGRCTFEFLRDYFAFDVSGKGKRRDGEAISEPLPLPGFAPLAAAT